MSKIIPTKKKFWDTTKSGLVVGSSGLVAGILMQVTKSPFISKILSGTVIGAIVASNKNYQTESKIIVGNQYSDAIESLLVLGA